MTHCGASYDCRTQAEFEVISEQERALTVRAAERLRAAGLPCPIVSVGSTPSIHYATDLTGVTEARVGVYVFGDLVQANLGTCSTDDIAIGVLASVIGHNRPHGRVLVDAGFLAMSRDRGMADGPADWGYGAICDAVTGEIMDDVAIVDQPGARHHHRAEWGNRLDRFPIGSRVRILPNHACATAAAYDRYHVIDGGPEVLARLGPRQRLVVTRRRWRPVAPRILPRTTRSCAAVPLPAKSVGCQPSSCRAREMSGLRRCGSSCGKSRWTKLILPPVISKS